MAINVNGDLDIFFFDFGEECTYIDNLGVSHVITAMRLGEQEVYNAGYGDFILEGSDPILQCKTSDIAGLKKENSVIWEGVNYVAVHILPDPQSPDKKLSIVILSNGYL